tara:strand:+ start:120 stop:797 length:678 start_codon:yes stop_codon:yes gene_type:complete
MKRYKGKYRNESHRLKGWDYSRNGHYFLTINTHGRECHFGDIVNSKMILNDFGKIAENEWFKSFEIRNELSLNEFILMPNHLHAIVCLEFEQGSGLDHGTGTRPVGTHGRASLQVPNETVNINEPKSNEKPQNWMNHQPQPFRRKPKSISSFVAGYKSSVLNKIDDLIDERCIPMQKFNRRNPLWQANYYDHVIRDNQSYKNISEYILKNPEKWDDGERGNSGEM